MNKPWERAPTLFIWTTVQNIITLCLSGWTFFSLEIEVYLPGKLHLLRVIEDNSAYLNYWK